MPLTHQTGVQFPDGEHSFFFSLELGIQLDTCQPFYLLLYVSSTRICVLESAIETLSFADGAGDVLQRHDGLWVLNKRKVSGTASAANTSRASLGGVSYTVVLPSMYACDIY